MLEFPNWKLILSGIAVQKSSKDIHSTETLFAGFVAHSTQNLGERAKVTT